MEYAQLYRRGSKQTSSITNGGGGGDDADDDDGDRNTAQLGYGQLCNTGRRDNCSRQTHIMLGRNMANVWSEYGRDTGIML